MTASSGSAVEGVAVSFSAAAGSGTVGAATVTTDADGKASTNWTVGSQVGTNLDTVFASVSGVQAPAVFTATVNPGAAASMESLAGDAQNGVAGVALPQPLVVVVRDQFGNPRSKVDVSWSVTGGGGSITPAISTTGPDGRASASWSPGSEGVNTAQAAVAGLGGSPVIFNATVNAGETKLVPVSGDAQTGPPGQALALPLVVSVTTLAGAPVGGVAVAWAVSSGGGSLSQASTPTDGQGQASTVWTLGPGLGHQSVTASVMGANGSPLTFNATAATPSTIVTISGVSPTPMIEGQPATLTGTGFSVSPGNNKVKIEGVAATVTAASATSLTVTVPTFNCQPARTTPLQVSVGAETSNVLAQGLNPPAFTAAGVGQELVLQNPAEFCLQFAPATASEDYLIGVQSTSDVVSSLTPVSLTSVAAAGQPAAAPLAELSRSMSAGAIAPTDPSLRLRRQRTIAEAKLRQQEREQIYPLLRQSRSRMQAGVRGLAAAIPPTLQAGDTIPIRYPGNGNLCTSYVEVKTVVRVLGQRGIWLEDVENPAGGLTQTDVQQLSDEFDTKIYGTVTDYFGPPTDLDQNQRIAIVLTRQVNKLRPGVAGHVGPQDLVSRSDCPSSDEGEIYYSVVPDPAGTLGDPVSREVVMAIAIQIIAHEFTHIIQLGQRFILHDLEPDPVWMLEGQAMLAEEITGHEYEGRSPGKNYGFDVAFNEDDPSSIDWYSQPFVGLFYYFGFRDRESKVTHAPEECTWLAPKPTNPGPCLGNLDVYGAPWSLLRWMSDQFGSRFPNGEAGLHQALILTPATGYDALAEVSGVPAKTLLAQWAAMLYVDDRVPGAAPSLTMPSWNLLDISNAVVESAQLIPEARTFSSFTDQVSVRAASSAYFRVSGTARPGTAIRVRSRSDAPLPANMQVFVVRLQ